MALYNQIVFAADLSDESQHLLLKVKALVSAFQAKLDVVHVVEHLVTMAYQYIGSNDIQQQLVDDAHKRLQTLGAELGVDQSRQHVIVGHPKTEILNFAKEINADLIVVGSHGRHGLAILLGSTSNAIVHGANCDVLTIRAT